MLWCTNIISLTIFVVFASIALFLCDIAVYTIPIHGVCKEKPYVIFLVEAVVIFKMCRPFQGTRTK